MRRPVPLRQRIFLLFVVLALAICGALALGAWMAWHRNPSPDLLAALVQASVVAGFAALAAVAGIWYLFDLGLAKPADHLSGTLRAGAQGEAAPINVSKAGYLAELAEAAAQAARRLSDLKTALSQTVERETNHLAAEKERLEALLSDVPVGVILCSGDHQLVFYNGTAMGQIGAEAAPGLDRSLFDYLRAGPIRLALDRLRATGDADAATDLLCASVSGNQVLTARLRLLPDTAESPGYVLTLRDVTADHAAHSAREALLSEMLDRVRRPAANLSSLIEALPDTALGDSRLEAALRHEISGLSTAVQDFGARVDAGHAVGATLGLTRASDLIDGLRAKLEAQGQRVMSDNPAPLLLRCNGFEVIALLSHLATHLMTARTDLHLTLDEDGTHALFRMRWAGAPVTIGALDRWLTEPLDAALPGVTGRHLLNSHAAEVWPETLAGDGQALCCALTIGRRDGPRPEALTRAVVYDFDLLGKSRGAADLADTRLSALTYVVFDTETTGLLPNKGDKIVQIAATRIVNGRIVRAEVFDSLVNPGRPIPAASTVVHGITDEMVQGAKPIAEVGRVFHNFAQDAVLVAHNAPFDMEFLRRAEPETGVRFDMPILDTVLMSAVIFGQHDDHSLDALTHRLGITIPEEARHTALGDAVATAQAFVKLLTMIEARGLPTFGALLAEVRRHGRLLKDLN